MVVHWNYLGIWIMCVKWFPYTAYFSYYVLEVNWLIVSEQKQAKQKNVLVLQEFILRFTQISVIEELKIFVKIKFCVRNEKSIYIYYKKN